ncbi:MAG: hypothetical protein KDC82_04880, partial [Bacteroidetes bacterium]|nr:hypothetical protein [Bacteroidota bacterium]
WQAMDPLAGKYTWASPYCFVANKPIVFKDPDGRKIVWAQESFSKQVKKKFDDLYLKSKLFRTIVDALNADPRTFVVKSNETFKSAGGTFNLETGEISLGPGYGYDGVAEEFFHLYQNVFGGNRYNADRRAQIIADVKAGNISKDEAALILNKYFDYTMDNDYYNIFFIESEAKIFDVLVMYESFGSSDARLIDNEQTGGLVYKHIIPIYVKRFGSLGNTKSYFLSGDRATNAFFNYQNDWHQYVKKNLPANHVYNNGKPVNREPGALNSTQDPSPAKHEDNWDTRPETNEESRTESI